MVIKRKGMLAIPVTLLAVVYLFLAGTFFTLYSSQFGMIQAGRTALQAQQYAEIEADTLKLLSYDDLDATGAHARQAITSVAGADGWQDEITIAAEQTYGADAQNKQRIATIKVYKDGDTLSRYSLQVPLSSKGSGGSWGPPDWNNAVHISSPTASHTATTNGYVYAYGIGAYNTETGLYINNRYWQFRSMWTTTAVTTAGVTLFPVKKGDTFYITGSAGQNNGYDLYFIPCSK